MASSTTRRMQSTSALWDRVTIIWITSSSRTESCASGATASCWATTRTPEATAAVIDKDGWFHTGDLARVDEDGYYYITGRKKNLIILDSGENLSPEELEGMLEKCPAVQECIVKELGKKIGVVVYCKKEHQQTVRDFIAQMNRTVPLYKRIGVVEFSETPLPRNAAGKLVRK